MPYGGSDNAILQGLADSQGVVRLPLNKIGFNQ